MVRYSLFHSSTIASVLLLYSAPLFAQRPSHVLETKFVITSLAVSKPRNLIAVGCEDGTIDLFSMPKFESIFSLPKDNAHFFQEICRLQFSSDGMVLLSEVSFIPSGPIIFWDLPNQKDLHPSNYVWEKHSTGTLSSDGKMCAARQEGNLFSCQVFDLDTKNVHATLPLPIEQDYIVCDLCYSPDGSLIGGAARGQKTNDWSVIIWDAHSFKLLHVIEAMRGIKKGLGVSGYPKVLFSPHGRYVASIHASDNIMVWDTSTYKLMLSIHETDFGGFSDDETIFASADQFERKITLWDIKEGKGMKVIDATSVGEVECLAFTPNYLIVAGARDTFEERLPFISKPPALRTKELPGKLITFEISELMKGKRQSDAPHKSGDNNPAE
jgi:WD40 repeat protein